MKDSTNDPRSEDGISREELLEAYLWTAAAPAEELPECADELRFRSSDIRLPKRLRLGEDPTVVREGQSIDIHNGDCLEVLRSLPDASVDCGITSPPYWRIRDYGGGTWSGGRKGCDHRPPAGMGGALSTYAAVCGKCGAKRLTYPLGMEPTAEEFVENLCLVFDEVRRVLKDTGSIYVNIGDTYASRDKGVAREHDLPEGSLWNIPHRFALAMTERRWVHRNTLIWHKPSVSPSGVKSRFVVDYEPIFVFTKRSSGYYFDQPTVEGATVPERPARSILTVNSGVNLFGHDSAYPEGVVIPAVLASCPPDGVVLDPFLGTGTTAAVAAYYGRSAIGIEMSPAFCAGSAQRCLELGNAAVRLIPHKPQALRLPSVAPSCPPRSATKRPPVASTTATPKVMVAAMTPTGDGLFEADGDLGRFIEARMEGHRSYQVEHTTEGLRVLRVKDGCVLNRSQVREVRHGMRRRERQRRQELAVAA